MKRWEALSAIDCITINTVAISSNGFSAHVCSYTLYSHVTTFFKLLHAVQLKVNVALAHYRFNQLSTAIY